MLAIGRSLRCGGGLPSGARATPLRLSRIACRGLRAPGAPASTDDQTPGQPDTHAMTVHLLHRSRSPRHDWLEARTDPARYAAGLHAYAAATLDAASLRAWMVQRLMLDLSRDHAAAEELAVSVLKSQRAA